MRTLLILLLASLLPAAAQTFFAGQQAAVSATPASSGLTLPTISSGTYVLQLIGDDLTAGAAVSSWASRVGGWTADQGTVSKRPTAVAAAINGRTAARFDRVDDALAVTSFNSGGLSAITIFVMASLTSSAGEDVLFEHSANYLGVDGGFIFYKMASNQLLFAAQQGGFVLNSFVTSSTFVGAPYVFSGVNNKALSTDEATLWVDGSSSGTRPYNSNLGGTFDTHTFYIGARGGTSLFVGMDLAALIICSGALSTTDRQAIETALMNYY